MIKSLKLIKTPIFAIILIFFPLENINSEYIYSQTRSQNKIQSSASLSWLERRWEIRYVLFVMSKSAWESSKKRAIQENHDQKNVRKNLALWEEYFDPVNLINNNDSKNISSSADNWVVIAIYFDRDGRVVSPHSHPGPLQGRIDERLNFILSEVDNSENKIFGLGYWFMGINENIPMGVSPGFCEYQDMKPIVGDDNNNTAYRYGNKYLSSGIFLFGCREWGYQLRAPFRPYIDVTSYSKPENNPDKVLSSNVVKNKKILKKSNEESLANLISIKTTVLDFIGWSDFEHRKPVIGQHFGKWYCYFECPNGEAPGPIDIESWTKRNGWRIPIPPTRMPVFPDDPNLQGDYPDAYNSLSD